MSDVAIQIENLSKQYRLGLVGTGTLSHDLNRWWHLVRGKEDPYLKVSETNDRAHKGKSDYVWALKDINLEVRQGEVLGIIGKNGAGKSTLLKILSRVTAPTTGTIKYKGRIGSLLEVGTGFHQELTGRENIFLNGTILGMTRAEVQSKLDEIVDFSGVERYVDTPVKRYSSGMLVRLAFAVAAHLEPEILAIDEVLAVGDADFQKRAVGKMEELSNNGGRTVLLVSHNMASVQQLCKRGVLLEDGVVDFTGTIGEAIQRYQSNGDRRNVFEGSDGEELVLVLKHAEVLPDNGNAFYTSSNIFINMIVEVWKRVGQMVIGFNLYNEYGCAIARCDYNDYSHLDSLEAGAYKVAFKIPAFTLSNGSYRIVFDLTEANEKCYTTDKSNLSFEVIPDNPRFSENIRIKSSIIRQNWFLGCVRV